MQHYAYLPPVWESKRSCNDFQNEDKSEEDSKCCHHAVVFFNGTTTSKESNNEYNHANNYDQYWSIGKLGCKVAKLIAILVTYDGSNDDEDESTKLNLNDWFTYIARSRH